MNQTEAIRPLNRLQQWAIIAAGVGALIALGGLMTMGGQSFFQAYLMAYIFWFGLGMGSWILLMIHHLTGGRWGFVVRRLLEAGAMTLPLMALLFVPIILGMNNLYIWTDQAVVAADPILLHKSAYLNTGAFILRAGIYFAIWIGFIVLLYQASGAQDYAEPGNFRAAGLMRRASAIGVVTFILTMTLAAVDWGMSIEPHFFSTIYGVLYMIGQGLSTLAFLILILSLVGDKYPFTDVISPDRIHDLGKLMLAFVILWTYASYAQYIIIWSGNLPEYTPWYVRRTENGWQFIAGLLIAGHFALPFFILLSRRLKRQVDLIRWVALWILVMRMIDIYWIIAPDFYHGTFGINPLYIATHLALGGIWLTAFVFLIKRRPVLPMNDLRNDPRTFGGHAHAA